MFEALNAQVPQGPLSERWRRRCRELGLVSPARRNKFEVIVVGSGLAGASAAASLGELGYKVRCFCFQDSPRRAHSVAAQGGINAAKDYCNDGDSVERLFYDTIRGGDFRSREANVYRLAELSARIIDHCVAQGVPFAREYGGLLANRSFGGAQVSRTFYARGQTGQQLLLGAYQGLSKEIARGTVAMMPRREMLDLIVIDGRARGIVSRDLVTGALDVHLAHAVVLATGGYANAFFLSTNAKGSNTTAIWRAYLRGAAFANPCFVQFHPTCIPPSGEHQAKLTLMSESLRNDGRVWVPRTPGDPRPPQKIPEAERDYYLEREYPSYGNLSPRDIASRAAKRICDSGFGVGPGGLGGGLGVYLDLTDAIRKQGVATIAERYGNVLEMYQQLTSEDPYTVPLRIYPAAHYTMGGLWVDYDLMSNLPGLFVIGEANFSDHGANRLGASALMQGLCDGYFVLPRTVGGYLAGGGFTAVDRDRDEVRAALVDVTARIARLLSIRGSRSVTSFHRELGQILWQRCGMVRDRAGLEAARVEIVALRQRFYHDVNIPGSGEELNQELEHAGRTADFLELAELMCRDAIEREESCGSHFRTEHQTQDGEAQRNDRDFAHVAVWRHAGAAQAPTLTRELLQFDNVALAQRSYR
jgi:succinate dehydrogenase / fumarate reductase flavoprotein subunit